MGLHKLFLAFLAIGAVLCFVPLAAAQQCTDPPCPNNTVPCAHVNGTWEFGWSSFQWNLQSEPNPSAPGQLAGAAAG